MNIVAADWLPYSLPLRRPWQTSRGVFDVRQGRLLRLIDDGARQAWGDCAPLPEFGIDESAATAFAEETAMLDLAAQKAQQPLNAWLSGKPPVESVAVNGNLGSLSSIKDDALKQALATGYSILKIKVGIGDWRAEVAHLQRLKNLLPRGSLFRLDANAAWKMDEASAFVMACADLPIESLEEPLSQPTPAGLASLQGLASFPLAVDESIQLLDAPFFYHPPVRRLVLKPARHGGLLATIGLALKAQARGIECVVSSGLESACGLLACAHLAAAIAPWQTHGLGTAEWLAEDTGASPPVSAGRLILPRGTGLGFVPGLTQAARKP
ncbi:o-succinylbenzoate synthase [Dechloromonas denitrificans]|uniref:o-succinylbenzoate synthase n=1 Tax=Dechloromonas denitrificans TaxID=281362 RepID=UPI001CF7FDCF|nr:o-succinylbenzoate synthase [Dechloromonas denitrificans]UCV05402.1 o-succinylbenzoate synthase [Dechloromonas denitrificans]